MDKATFLRLYREMRATQDELLISLGEARIFVRIGLFASVKSTQRACDSAVERLSQESRGLFDREERE